MDNEFPDSDEEYDLIHKDDFEVLQEIQAQLNNEKNLKNNEEQTLQQTKKQEPFDINRPSTSYQANESYNHSVANSRKRNYDELFGDISDLLEKDIFSEFSEPKEKRPCWNETDAIIETFINTRKKFQEEDGHMLNKVKYYQDKKNDNISLRVPPWNFIALTRTFDSQRLYIRVKNEEKITVESMKPVRNLLSISYDQLKAEAEEIIVNNAKRANLAAAKSFDCDEISGTELWVDKYKPKKYTELLSDENVNRQFLYWLKLWDKIVFNKEISSRKKNINASTTMDKKFEDSNRNDVDNKGYPIHKIVLLTGPPGLGKTTLAHLAAKHAGYNIIEVNASDERGPDAFRQILRASTQMKAVIGKDPRPNCLILDEIDGAPIASIDELIKFVQGKSSFRNKKNKMKSEKERESCQRPIICICNELYTPSLRSLRNFALVISVPPVSTTRLVQRLMEIAQKEKLQILQNDLLKLVENCDCDIRSCLGTLQYMGDIDIKHHVSLGSKNTHKGLFDTWKEILKIPVTKTGILSIRDRVRNILKIVQSGDNEKLVNGIFHNYPMNSTTKISNISEAAEWFQFYDEISTSVLHNQSWSVMPYTNYAFLTWHLNLSTMQIPKLFYPVIVFETNQKIAKTTSILTMVKRYRGIDSVTLIMDVTPLLPDLLNPRIRTVSGHLYSSAEKAHLSRVVNIMIDFGLTLVQEKNMDGKYEYQLNPNINEIGCFHDCKNRIKMSYVVLQIISQELQIEYVKRSTIVTGITQNDTEKKVENKIKETVISNPVQSNKSIIANTDVSVVSNSSKEDNKSSIQISKHKNYFGEIVLPDDNGIKTNAKLSLKSDEIRHIRDIVKKYGVWYKYKEGLTTAIRRQVFMKDLL